MLAVGYLGRLGLLLLFYCIIIAGEQTQLYITFELSGHPRIQYTEPHESCLIEISLFIFIFDRILPRICLLIKNSLMRNYVNTYFSPY